MTDHQRQMIEGYLPHRRDETLMYDEYYVQDTAGRVRRVRITDIFPNKDELEYGVVESTTGRRIDAGYFVSFRGFRKSHMYDNREDCRDSTHSCYDGWEFLRQLQMEEGI